MAGFGEGPFGQMPFGLGTDPDASVSPPTVTATGAVPTPVSNASVSPSTVTATGAVHTAVARVPSGPDAPILTSESNLTFGCAEEYTVVLTARDLETYAAEVRWSTLQWSRVLDEVSTASVIVPDVFAGMKCNIAFGSEIVPWRYGLRIERNGTEVWAGPITSLTRPSRNGAGADYVEIQASDAMAWMGKRTPTQDLSFVDDDAGTVFKAVLDDATSLDNLFGLECPDFTTGYTMTRDVLAYDFEYSLDVLTELGNSAVDWFMIGKKLAVYDVDLLGWYVVTDGVKELLATTDDPYGRYVYGLFTDEAFIQRPGFSIDGMAQGNNIYVPGTDSGEAGFRRYWTASDVSALDGLLTYVDVNSLYRPQEGTPITSVGVFQQRADSLLALRSTAPVILSGGALSQTAPVTMDGMYPGSLWAMDLAELGVSQLLDAQRLKRIDVRVDAAQGGMIEQVSPTLMPLGTDESQAL